MVMRGQGTVRQHRDDVAVSDIENLPLFKRLEQAQLIEVIRNSRMIMINDNALNASIGEGRGLFIVLEGAMKIISFEERFTSKNISVAARPAVRRIAKGGVFGKIWITNHSDPALDLKYVAEASSRLMYIPAAAMMRMCSDWPDFLLTIAEILERDQLETLKALSEMRTRMFTLDNLVESLQSISDQLVRGGVGAKNEVKVVQRKFRVDNVPESISQSPFSSIEQAYLDENEDIAEDRIRKTDNGNGIIKYVRTRRIIRDGVRQEVPQTISVGEYERLKSTIKGRLIKKRRYSMDVENTDIKISFDEFIEPKNGLFLVEISAPSDEILEHYIKNSKTVLDLFDNYEDVSGEDKFSNKLISLSG